MASHGSCGFGALIFAAATALAASGCGGDSKPDPGPVGTVDVTAAGVGRKLQPSDAPGTSRELRLAGPRASYQIAQLVVRGLEGRLEDVTVSATALEDVAGHAIPASNVTLFRELYIDFTGVDASGGHEPVPESSANGDGRIPDPLLPLVDPYTGAELGEPFAVAADEVQPLLVEVRVPTGIPGGLYTGSVSVVVPGQAAVQIPLFVDVWDLDLPDMNAVTTHFRLSVNDLIRYHRDTWACSGASCWLEWLPQSRLVVKRYEELAHAHRLDVAQEFIRDPGNGCEPPADTDWDGYDADMAPYMDGSYFADGVPSGRLPTPFSPGVTEWGLEAECTQAEYTALAAAWASHLEEKGWFDRAIVYAYDEPPAEVYPAIALHSSWLQDADPDWKAHVMDTTSPDADNAATLNPALGIYCVAPSWYDDWYHTGYTTYGRDEWPDLFARASGCGSTSRTPRAPRTRPSRRTRSTASSPRF
jgi:hypothetical protein